MVTDEKCVVPYCPAILWIHGMENLSKRLGLAPSLGPLTGKRPL